MKVKHREYSEGTVVGALYDKDSGQPLLNMKIGGKRVRLSIDPRFQDRWETSQTELNAEHARQLAKQARAKQEKVNAKAEAVERNRVGKDQLGIPIIPLPERPPGDVPEPTGAVCEHDYPVFNGVARCGLCSRTGFDAGRYEDFELSLAEPARIAARGNNSRGMSYEEKFSIGYLQILSRMREIVRASNRGAFAQITAKNKILDYLKRANREIPISQIISPTNSEGEPTDFEEALTMLAQREFGMEGGLYKPLTHTDGLTEMFEALANEMRTECAAISRTHPDAVYQVETARAKIAKALGELEIIDQVCITLAVGDECSPEDISEILKGHLTPRQVSFRLARAYDKLREKLVTIKSEVLGLDFSAFTGTTGSSLVAKIGDGIRYKSKVNKQTEI